MRLATFNLENLDLPPKAPVPIEERARILRPQLERAAADILCLQEVNGQYAPGAKERSLEALNIVLKGTRYENYNCVSTRAAGRKGVADIHNLVVLSHFPIEGHRDIRHDLVPAPVHKTVTAIPPLNEPSPVEWDRPLLLTDILLPGSQRLTLINAHLRAPLAAPIPGQKEAPFVWKSVGGWAEGFFVASLKRIGQALELRLMIEELIDADPDRLIAVCGDFNAADHETALKIMIAAEEDTGNGRLAPRTLIPLERSAPADQRYTVMHHGRPQMLDHILVSRSLLGKFRHIEIHNESLEDELVGYTRVDTPPDSYHAPVIAEFELDDSGAEPGKP